MPKHIQNINRMPRGGVMFEKLLQYFYFAEKTADWILNCHDDGDKQTQKFLGCVLPQGNRILFLSCGSNFFVSPKKKSLTSATPSVLVLPTPVWPCPRLCQRGEPKTRIRQLVQLKVGPQAGLNMGHLADTPMFYCNTCGGFVSCSLRLTSHDMDVFVS